MRWTRRRRGAGRRTGPDDLTAGWPASPPALVFDLDALALNRVPLGAPFAQLRFLGPAEVVRGGTYDLALDHAGLGLTTWVRDERVAGWGLAFAPLAREIGGAPFAGRLRRGDDELAPAALPAHLAAVADGGGEEQTAGPYVVTVWRLAGGIRGEVDRVASSGEVAALRLLT